MPAQIFPDKLLGELRKCVPDTRTDIVGAMNIYIQNGYLKNPQP